MGRIWSYLGCVLQLWTLVSSFHHRFPFQPRIRQHVAAVPAASDNERATSIGLYIHIPYCRRRCRYCDFAIVPVGPHAATDTLSDGSSTTRGFLEMNQNYLEAILQEIALIRNNTRDGKVSLTSIYFGGGTPSLAPIDTIEKILEAVQAPDGPFVVESDAEITIEMDPGTFSLDKARALKVLGINRVSLGVQSFDDEILELLGRTHRKRDIWEALSILETAFGMDLNYSIDLISGLPGLSLATWVETLETAVNLKPRPAHLSIYDLQIESVSRMIEENLVA